MKSEELPALPDRHDTISHRFAPCPGSPNCVCSDAVTGRHRIEPLRLAAPPRVAWQAAVSGVRAMPRARILVETKDYLHASIPSAVFGFVDDLELHLRPEQDIIAVRSASRSGHYDFSVNRRRVEKLRAILRRQGVVD